MAAAEAEVNFKYSIFRGVAGFIYTELENALPRLDSPSKMLQHQLPRRV